MRILIVEDETKLAELIAKGLKNKGYAPDIIEDGKKAYTRLLLHHSDYDLVILDLMLPGMSGSDICKEIRGNNITLPILILTARNETEHKVELLLAGADDYLPKPFSLSELWARIEALLRRPNNMTSTTPILQVGDIELDSVKHIVKRKGQVIPLTLKEFRVLEYFLHRPGEVINREDLLAHLWDFNYESFSNVTDVHIKNIRNKIDQGNSPSLLETVRGIGYRFRA